MSKFMANTDFYIPTVRGHVRADLYRLEAVEKGRIAWITDVRNISVVSQGAKHVTCAFSDNTIQYVWFGNKMGPVVFSSLVKSLKEKQKRCSTEKGKAAQCDESDYGKSAFEDVQADELPDVVPVHHTHHGHYEVNAKSKTKRLEAKVKAYEVSSVAFLREIEDLKGEVARLTSESAQDTISQLQEHLRIAEDRLREESQAVSELRKENTVLAERCEREKEASQALVDSLLAGSEALIKDHEEENVSASFLLKEAEEMRRKAEERHKAEVDTLRGKLEATEKKGKEVEETLRLSKMASGKAVEVMRNDRDRAKQEAEEVKRILDSLEADFNERKQHLATELHTTTAKLRLVEENYAALQQRCSASSRRRSLRSSDDKLEAILCCMCLEHLPDTLLMPCRHLLCSADSATVTVCPKCSDPSKPITEKIKVYL